MATGKTTKRQEHSSQEQWVHVPSVDRAEPSTEITADSVIAFRNGVAKYCDRDGIAKTMHGVVAYRAVIDLDHLARLMESETHRSSTTFSVTVKPKHKKDRKRFAADIAPTKSKAGRAGKRSR